MKSDQPAIPQDSNNAVDDNDAASAREVVWSHWQQLLRSGITVHSLQTFFAQHKYLVMSRDIDSYRRIGKMLATVTQSELPAVAQQTIEIILIALQKPATRGGHTNVLQHIRGYLKRILTPIEKAELTESIEQYRKGDIPLAEPLTLLREHFQHHPDAYIEQQVFMQLYLDASRSQDHV